MSCSSPVVRCRSGGTKCESASWLCYGEKQSEALCVLMDIFWIKHVEQKKAGLSFD